MWEVITGEFFWGVIVGLILSFFGGWCLAKFSFRMQQSQQKQVVIKFCSDTIQNIQNIIEEMDSTRDRAKAIHHDFLDLLEVEIGVYGRNREHLIHLPDSARSKVRKFMNDCAIKRADVVKNLAEFQAIWQQGQAITGEGRAPEAARLKEQAEVPLKEAQRAADKLVAVSKEGSDILKILSNL